MRATERATAHIHAHAVAVSFALYVFRNMSWLSFACFYVCRKNFSVCVRIFFFFSLSRVSLSLVVFLCARGRPADIQAFTDS